MAGDQAALTALGCVNNEDPALVRVGSFALGRRLPRPTAIKLWLRYRMTGY
jgi:hypothetical protein